jgi:hypothetical protein
VAAVDVVRVVAGMGSAAVWIGGTMVGVIAVLVILLVGLFIWATKADTKEKQDYCLQLLREFREFLRDLFRSWGKQ